MEDVRALSKSNKNKNEIKLIYFYRIYVFYKTFHTLE